MDRNLPLILGSGSPHRRELLDRLQLPYRVERPDIDESRHPGEPPEDYVRRLSLEKAQAVADRIGPALIIGSDQAAVLDGELLGKPGSTEAASEQLSRASGRRVSFLTGLCLLDAERGEHQLDVVPFHVHFRPLSAERIRRYLDREPALDCAGSFKSEGLGITLFERLDGEDPTALVGLPLIRLTAMLQQAGIELP